MDELAGAESVNVNLGKFALNMREQIEIPLESELGMMSTLHQNLRAALGNGFLDLSVHLLVGDHIGIIVAFDPVESAKFAIDIANVRIIDVAVNNVGYDLVATPFVGAGF